MTSKWLIGMKSICAYCGRSKSIIKRWIAERGFPAREIDNVWHCCTDDADQWLRDQLREPCQ
jgi:hypothetical protein